MGRIDDVLNVAGHRLGTMEIESALVAHVRVAEAAVVGKPHEIKGEAVFAYVVCRGERPSGDTRLLVEELRKWVGEQLGAIAKPDEIRFTDNLPKTRSGKIMRRLLRAIARGEEITQDISTLENPSIVDQLRGVEASPRRVARKRRKVPAGVRSKRARSRPASKPARKAARKATRATPRKAAKKAKGAKKESGLAVRKLKTRRAKRASAAPSRTVARTVARKVSRQPKRKTSGRRRQRRGK